MGGLTAPEARELVEERFQKPITLVVSQSRKLRVTPSELGAAAYVSKAVKLAVRVRREGYQVPLKIDVASGKLKRYLAEIGAQTDRKPVDASLTLRNFKPVAHESSPGRRLMQVVAAQKLSLAIRKHERSFELPYQELKPTVTEADLGHGDRDQARLEPAPLLQRGQAQADVPRRDRPVLVPDARRHVRDRDHAARPVVVPAAGLRLGRGREADPARAPGTRSGRAGWGSRRRTSGSTGRPTPPRSATPRRTAASAC